MDKKSIGKALFNMRKQDELRFVDVDKNKEFEVNECCYHYDNIADKQVVEFLIRETKKNDKHR
jgi:hypothetical protein